MLVKRQPISHSERENYEQGVSWKPCVVIFYFTTKPLSLIKIHIHQVKQNHYFFSSLPHFHSCDPFINSSTTRRKTPQVIIIFSKNLKTGPKKQQPHVGVVFIRARLMSICNSWLFLTRHSATHIWPCNHPPLHSLGTQVNTHVMIPYRQPGPKRSVSLRDTQLLKGLKSHNAHTI